MLCGSQAIGTIARYTQHVSIARVSKCHCEDFFNSVLSRFGIGVKRYDLYAISATDIVDKQISQEGWVMCCRYFKSRTWSDHCVSCILVAVALKPIQRRGLTTVTCWDAWCGTISSLEPALVRFLNVNFSCYWTASVSSGASCSRISRNRVLSKSRPIDSHVSCGSRCWQYSVQDICLGRRLS